jgi:hypothetical protein
VTSLLGLSYSLQIGSQLWKEQALQIQVTLAAAPLIDVLTVRLPAAAPLDADIDDDVELTLNSGEKEEKVFTGAVQLIRRSFSEIEVKALNAGGILSQYYPAVTYENATTATVARNLCSDAGVSTGSLETGSELAFYAADHTRTAWQHIHRIFSWSGALVSVSQDNEVESAVVNATQAEVALRYGREIVNLGRTRNAAPIETFVVAGESGIGSLSSPDAHRPVTDFFAGNRPDNPSPTVRWSWTPALRTTSSAATAGAARKRSYTAAADRGVFTAFLQPQLRPGLVLEMQDLPSGLTDGPVWIHSVRHTLSERGALTRVAYFKGGDSFDPLALLGSLAGALGGLL